MKITIAGYGYVGKAVEAYLQHTSATTKIVDPEYYRILGKDLTCGLKTVSYTHLTLPTKA